MDDRGSGKTTRLMERTVYLLGELPEGCGVFITGAHSNWLLKLEQDFKVAGLIDVKFFTPYQIINGSLRGCRGVLLMDDFGDLTYGMRELLLTEKDILERRRRYESNDTPC